MRRNVTARTRWCVLCVFALVFALVFSVGRPAHGAEEYVIQNLPGIDPAVARAVGEDLTRCVGFYASHMKRRLGRQIPVYIYTTEEAFAQGVQQHGGESAVGAARWARTAALVVRNGNVFIHQGRIALMFPRDRSAAICGAVGLLFQRELITERGQSGHQWLRQGYAEMMAILALDAFGLEPAAGRRAQAVAALRAVRRSGRGFPRLADIDTIERYQVALDRYGPANVQYFTLVTAEFLLSKSSHEAYATYFRGLAPRGGAAADQQEAFKTAFGMTVEQFQTQLDTYLADLTK